MAETSTDLNCRLLCACRSAYDIAPVTGVFTPDSLYYPAVQYTNTPQPFTGGDQLINAGLVGQNIDGIIVSFRGTLTPSLTNQASVLDWLQDFFMAPKAASNVPGMVSSGWYDATMTIIAQVAKAVQSLGPGSTNPVYVTGHSKGGAMASIGAYILNQTYGIPIQQVVTFASPKPGDPGFQTGYQSVINNQLRYENYGDIVPLVPPATEFIDLIVAVLKLIPGDVGQELVKLFESAETWNYAAVGSPLFIESAADQYNVVSDEPIESQVWIVVKEFGEDCLNDFDFTSFGNAHSSTCGYGYMSGTCPTGVCPPTAGSTKSRSRKSRPRSNR